MDDDLAHTIEVLALALQHDPLGRYFQLDTYGLPNSHPMDYHQSRRWFSDLVTLLWREGAICMMAVRCRCGKTYQFHHATSAKLIDNRLPPEMMNIADADNKKHPFLPSKSIADEEALANEAKKRHLGSKPHWALALIGRHPAYTGPPVAGRVILPFIERARKDGHAVWLEASNLHARDVYLKLGFRVVEELKVGKNRCDVMGNLARGGEGISVWAMMMEKSLLSGFCMTEDGFKEAITIYSACFPLSRISIVRYGASSIAD